MKVLIVLAHPNPDSFNGAVAKTISDTLAQARHEVKVKDLYKQGWNPLLSLGDLQQLYSGSVPPDIAAEQADVQWAELVVFVYPIWWFEQPAILKGWFDRVFGQGFAYKFTENGMIEGLLKGRKAFVITTSGANQENMQQNGVLDAIRTCMVNGTLGFSGFEDIIYKNLYEVPTVSDEDRKNMLEEIKGMFNKLA